MASSRRDLAQAHAFGAGRLLSALLHGDPDQAHPATRRMIGGTLGSLGLALLATVGLGVYGSAHPQDARAWREPGVLVRVTETGERFVVIGGVLHPVLNDASARLLAGTTPNVVSVGRAALDGTPRGLPVGIPGGPDGLPSPDRLVSGPWTVCGGAPDAGPPAVLVGDRPAGVAVDAGHALAVGAPDGTLFLLWNGTRLRVPDPRALVALGYPAGLRPRPVAASVLNAVPQGPDLVAAPAGAGSTTVLGRSGVPVGTVFAIAGNNAAPDYYLARHDGLAPIDATDALLTVFEAGSRIDTTATRAQLAAEPRILGAADVPGHPPTPVPLRDGPETVCSVVESGTGTGTDGPRPAIVLAELPAAPGQPGVRVAGGHGALVRATPGPGVTAATVYLLTDTGLKYPLASPDTAARLGYAGVTPVAVPAMTLALIPTGATLDPAAAAAYHEQTVSP